MQKRRSLRNTVQGLLNKGTTDAVPRLSDDLQKYLPGMTSSIVSGTGRSMKTLALSGALELIVDKHWLDDLGGSDFHYIQSVGSAAASRFEEEEELGDAHALPYGSTQAGTARAADSVKINKLSRKARRAEQLAVVLHPCKAPISGVFVSPLMRRLHELATASSTPTILKYVQTQPATIRTVDLPHRLQHLALEGRSANPLLRLLLSDRPVEVQPSEPKPTRDRTDGARLVARPPTSPSPGKPSKPQMFRTTVAGAVVVAVVRQAVKLAAAKTTRWSRPTSMNVEGQFAVLANDNVLRHLRQLEQETRPISKAFEASGVRGVQPDQGSFSLYGTVRSSLPRFLRARFDPYLLKQSMSRDALAALPDMANVYQPLSYRSLYQMVSRCPHLTVVLAWLQAYLTPAGARGSDAKEGELLLAAIVEYWLLGTADPRVFPYQTPVERARARTEDAGGLLGLGAMSRAMPRRRRALAGSGRTKMGIASRGQYGKGKVADAPGTALGKRVQSGKLVLDYRAEYVQGSEEVMDCVAMMYLHLYASSSTFDSRGRRRSSARQDLACFRRSDHSQSAALGATCGAGYGGNLHSGFDFDGGVDANGTMVGRTFWRSSFEAARAEFAQGKPAARAADRMGVAVGARVMRTLGVPDLLQAPDVLVRLQGPAFHFFRVHASKLEETQGSSHNSSYSRMVDALIGLLTPWRAALRGSHDPELPPDRLIVARTKPEQIRDVLGTVAASTDGQYESLQHVAAPRPSARRSPVDQLTDDQQKQVEKLLDGRDETWAAVMAQSYGDFPLVEHAEVSGYFDSRHLPNGQVYGTLVPALSDAQHFNRTRRCYRYMPSSYGIYDGSDSSSSRLEVDLGSGSSAIAHVAPAVCPAKRTVFEYSMWEGSVPFHFSFFTHGVGAVFQRVAKSKQISFGTENSNLQRIERLLDVLDDRVVGTLYACSDVIEEMARPAVVDDRGTVTRAAGLARQIAEEQIRSMEQSPQRSPVAQRGVGVVVGARHFLLAIDRMGRDYLGTLVAAARVGASQRPQHLRARQIDEKYVCMLLQLLQQHYVAVGEPNLLETMSSLRESASKVLRTLLEGLDTVKRDIERHEEALQKSILSKVLAVVSFGQIDILDLSQALQYVAKNLRALYIDFWGHILPSASSNVLGILRYTQTLAGYLFCCCTMAINSIADGVQSDMEGMQPGDEGAAGSDDASGDASMNQAFCCTRGSFALVVTELIFGRRRNEPAAERLQYAALRLSDIFGLEGEVISFAKGDVGGGGERGLHESQLLKSIKKERKELVHTHALHLTHADLLDDQPAWWHGTLLRLALAADSAARFALGRAIPDYQSAYRRAMIASFRLHQQALDSGRDDRVPRPTVQDVSALARNPAMTASLPGDEELDWDNILSDGKKLRWAAHSMREDGHFEAWYDGFVLPSLPDDRAFTRLLHLGDEALYGAVLGLLVSVVAFLAVGWGAELAALGVVAFVGIVLLWLLVPVPPLVAPQSLAAGRT